ncbi:MAG: GH3 auxin-responsive promoter family protein [Muribaculaceae bacterium]|nr:GH3 auxin-responsive promoter family protein [Muribaculaceae bacterium]
MDFTPFARHHFLSRLPQQVRYIDHADAVQQGELVWLVEKAALTKVGRRHDFSTVRTYREFAARVPLCRYEDIRTQVMRMINGERDVLWPGRTMNFAQSSGTTGGKSKYIPVTTDSLRRNHYQGASDVMSHYMNLNPATRIFSGKGLILGGSFATELQLPRGVRVGDLSATLIEYMNPMANLFRIPSKRVALLADWSKKLPMLVEGCMDANVTNLSGVPSWFLTLIKAVLRRKGAACLHEVWPNLEVFFHGGIDFGAYRSQYESLCDMSRMHFLDTYNASEGFFAVQSDWGSEAMLLLLDAGVFYEFIPLAEVESEQPRTLPVWEVEAGQTYELVITACNGLWRYRLGDTVTVEQTHPVKIRIAGRTASYINAFGEELMVHNADHAITLAAQETQAQVRDYTAAPVYATTTTRGRHQWLVEFDVPPADLQTFITAVDRHLKEVNSDYEAKRQGGLFLDPPTIVAVARGTFERWLASTGRLGGQRKVPRLCNDRHIADAVLQLHRSIGENTIGCPTPPKPSPEK